MEAKEGTSGLNGEQKAGTSSGADGENEEEEVLLEPRFKYTRILNGVPSIFAKDQASCIAVHDKFIALGTRAGYIYILDHLGDVHPESTVRHHRCAVTKIAIDTSGSYLISCSPDVRVSIYGIGSTEYTQTIELKTAACSVAISPDFAKRNSGQMFVTADRNLTLHERRFFSSTRGNVLYQGMDRDGYISQVSWHNSFILFTNDTGTRVYDRSLDRIIALIQPLHDVSETNSQRVVPSHCWINNKTFAIGWANTVSICAIIEPSESEATTAMRKIEVNYAWKLDMLVADISFTTNEGNPHEWKEIAVFGVKIITNDDKDGKESAEVQLALLEPEDLEEYVLTTEDRIEMRGCNPHILHQFHMCALPDESLYFLLGVKEFIEAKPYSADDRVRWYVENGMLKEAMNYANKHESQLEQLCALDIGKQYVDMLMKQGKFSQAARFLPLVCGKHKDLWEYYVNEFEQNNVVLQVAKYLPVKDPQLEPESYQSVLVAALYNHPLLFYKLIKAWSPDLYRVGAIIDMAMKRVTRDDSALNSHDKVAIFRSLAILYTYERKYDKAILLYISMNDKSVFQLIERFHLFDLVKNDISRLMLIDSNLAVRLLIENASCLPAKTVLTQISKFPKLQLAYLNRLFDRNEGDEFADLAIRLYADHDPKKLLPFLRKNESYDIAKALEICERKQLTQEMLFLLGRSGNLARALDLLINKLNRIDLAIDFCRETDDADLWESLIDASMNEPARITQLLNNAGEYVDPINIIEKIPPQIVIPGLRDSLTKILRDYELQVQVQEGCKMVTLDDCSALFAKYIAACNRPIEINNESLCTVCRQAIMPEESRSTNSQIAEDVLVFGCGHLMHRPCYDKAVSEKSIRKRSSRSDEGDCPLCFDDDDKPLSSHSSALR